MSNDLDLRFLESSANVRRVLEGVVGRRPSASIARGIGVCIEQGRLFFESATSAPLQIRPLPLYYGILAYAKAIVAARSLKSLSALSSRHGLSDVSSATARLADLEIKVSGHGTFQEFNNTIRAFEGLRYFEQAMSRWHALPTAESHEIDGLKISLKNLLGRIHGLGELYQRTFDEDAKTLPFLLNLSIAEDGTANLRIDLRQLYNNRGEVQEMVEMLRGRFPILEKWRLHEVTKAWDHSIFIFINQTQLKDEFATDWLIQHGDRFNGVVPPDLGPITDFRNLLEPLSGGVTENYPMFQQDLHGRRISDLALSYMAVYLLSSLVRYRPQIWVHAVSRSVHSDRSADDQALALVEALLTNTQGKILRLMQRAFSED